MPTRYFLLLLSLFSLFALSPERLHPQTSHKRWLIVGGYENIGFGFARYLLDQNIPVTLLVPPTERDKTHKLFKNKNNVTITTGYVSAEKCSLRRAAQNCDYILLDMEFPYETWEHEKRKLTRHAITVAQETGALLIYPGRIYSYGLQSPIRENSRQMPNSHQGKVMLDIEQMLKQASEKKNCRVLIPRVSYPFGPGISDALMKNSFQDIPRTGELTWLYRSDLPCQFVYTHDIARFTHHVITELEKKPEFPRYYLTHCPSYNFASIDQFGTEICKLVNQVYTPLVLSSWKLKFYALLHHDVNRGIDLSYAFNNSILLDETEQKKHFPHFSLTDQQTAFRETLSWFAT